MFAAGIDGGGTAARVELRDPEGQLISRRVFGPFNITGIGRDAFIGREIPVFYDPAEPEGAYAHRIDKHFFDKES